ncbi:MAG: hypothetical protein EP343_07725 [Deltaproteobacteria bacterium]|nr:MAG: hypothetical protein EP343_07725 [Deltaproteobacteria bacterium]
MIQKREKLSMRKHLLWIACLLGCLVALPHLASAKRYTLRIATLAPKGSSWVKVMDAFRWEVRKKSKGKLRIKLYTGGRMGDEKVVVRKVRLDSLQGAAITAIGLSQINPALLALQLPFMFRSYKELYAVRRHLDSHLRKQLLDKGFVLLGWGDLGYIYLFSKLRLQSIDDLKKAKIWAWTDDPITKQFSDKGGLTPRLLGLLHVRQGLQTGTIDTVVGTPLTLIAMQWHSYVKYRVAYRFAIGLGATVVSKKSFDRLPPNLQKILLKTAAKYHRLLLKIVRRDNRRALKTLRKRGIKGIKMTKKQKREVRQIAAKVNKYFIGKLYSKSDYMKIINAIRKYRKGQLK